MGRAAILIGVLLLLALAGCGGDDDGDSGSGGGNGGGGNGAGSAGAGAGASGEVEIKMEGFQFVPKTATIRVGQEVKWVNEDSAPHNATAESGASFESGDFGQGGGFAFTPTRAGTIRYECTLHPGMTGTLQVSR
jgi:plastocyanin